MPLMLPGSLHPSNTDAISCDDSSNGIGFSSKKDECKMFIREEENIRSTEINVKYASADIAGVIVVWDILDGNVISSFQHLSTVPSCIQWYAWEDTNRDFLLTLHSPNFIILWNTATGERIWNVTLLKSYTKFTIDPFDVRCITIGETDGSLLLLNDALLHKAPSVDVESMVVFHNPGSLQQMVYHSACANILFAATADEIVCIEVESRCVVWRSSNEAPILHIFPCIERDAFWTVHSNGFVNLRLFSTKEDDRGNVQLHYKRIMSNETQRQSSHHRIAGAAFCPVTQMTFALLYNSGKITFYQLASEADVRQRPYRSSYLTDILKLDGSILHEADRLKLSNINEIFSLGQSAYTIRMQPLNYAKNENQSCLAAIGNNQGIIQLVDVFSAIIYKEFHIHTCQIKCLDWGGVHSIISAAYSPPLNASSPVRNDIFITDIRTGESKRLRPEMEETPVEMLRVSFYHCYLAIGFRSEPLEIWHMKSMRLLRRMSRACPIIIDMAWSGKHHTMKKLTDGTDPVFRENLVVLDQDCHLYHVVVKGLHVRDGKEVNSELKSGASSLKCLVWKNDLLAMSDAWGRLSVWDLGRRQSRQTKSSSRGSILKMSFSRLSDNDSLAVLHSQCVAIWDCSQLTVLQILSLGSSITLVDMDLCGIWPVVLCSDNSFRYMPSVSMNSSVRQYDMPLLINVDIEKLFAKEGDINDGVLMELVHFSCESADISDVKSSDQNSSVSSNSNALENLRSLRVIHRLLGNRWISDLLSIVESKIFDVQLPLHLLLFWPIESFKQRAESTLSCMISLSGLSSKQNEMLVHRSVILHKLDWAMQLLLSSRDGSRDNALRACLLASNLTSEGAQSIVKLVATDMIANDAVTDGVQLLFLIGHGVDACRYLQAHNLWELSMTFAKLGLEDCSDVECKWMEHLSSKNVQNIRFYFLLASMAEWDRLLLSLYQSSQSKLAVHLLDILSSIPIDLAESTLELIKKPK